MPSDLVLPGAPPPDQPVSAEPIDGMSLEDLASFGVALATSGKPRKELLATRHLDETRFAFIEAGWMTRIATLEMRGDASLAQRYRELCDAALAAVVVPLADEETWARVVAALRRGVAPAVAARREAMSLLALSRSQAHWAQLFGRDPAARAAFEVRVAALES